MKLCNSVKYTGHKCELFNYCYMCFVFELAYKLNINSGHKIAEEELLIQCQWR